MGLLLKRRFEHRRLSLSSVTIGLVGFVPNVATSGGRRGTRSLGCSCPACANSKVSHIEGRLRALIGASPILKILDHEKDVRLNLPWGKSNHLKVDILAYTARTGAPVVIEYDGAGWHQSDQAIARDSAKTKALLAAGSKVVRVRQTPLPELHIEDDNLKQYRIKWYRTDTALQAVVDELELWA